MTPLQLKLAAIAKWLIFAVVAVAAVFLLFESRKSDSAKTVRILTIINIFLIIVARLGLEPPPAVSVSELRALREFNAKFDGVHLTPDLEKIAKGVELSGEADPLQLAQSKLARGKLEEAVDLFDQALLEMRNMQRVIAETHFYKAVALSRLGRESEAIIEADLAHAILPGMSMASFIRCRSLRRLNRLDRALASCETAIREDPNNGWAWGEKGTVIIAMGAREMDRVPRLFE